MTDHRLYLAEDEDDLGRERLEIGFSEIRVRRLEDVPFARDYRVPEAREPLFPERDGSRRSRVEIRALPRDDVSHVDRFVHFIVSSRQAPPLALCTSGRVLYLAPDSSVSSPSFSTTRVDPFGYTTVIVGFRTRQSRWIIASASLS